MAQENWALRPGTGDSAARAKAAASRVLRHGFAQAVHQAQLDRPKSHRYRHSFFLYHVAIT